MWRQWHSGATAILVLAFAGFAIDLHTASAAEVPIAKRSRERLLPTLEFDRRAAAAFQSRAVAELSTLYTQLRAAGAESERLVAAGKSACGCDVAVAKLLIVVGFAVNKLDGKGRYQSWMTDESLQLLADYQGYLVDCAKDAAAAPVTAQLQPHHVKAL